MSHAAPRKSRFYPGRRPSEQFRQLLETLPVAAYTCDADGLITYFNCQAAALWGREPKLNDPADRFCGSFALFSSDGSPIEHERCWMALALQNDRAYNREEILVGLPDGSRRTVLAHANPIHDAEGRIVAAVNVLVDIGDRRRAEEAQALLAAIVESSHDAIVSRTLDGRVLTWNSAATHLFGSTASETIGRPSTEVLPGASRPRASSACAAREGRAGRALRGRVRGAQRRAGNDFGRELTDLRSVRPRDGCIDDRARCLGAEGDR